ncbi:hypothetical protein LuPra_03948 [Luteitalea pratensis]|uniref:Uncharacterized protein n=1 Tax=Luteitalea pratensis TaxID=1855912 RepID=A0A143PS95_LUTPR|nr:hypothetical protein [Luteitalea pratensis]AMY10709.1 hypothetical protein LuPra_03948 [Luteitalea pratensis]
MTATERRLDQQQNAIEKALADAEARRKALRRLGQCPFTLGPDDIWGAKGGTLACYAGWSERRSRIVATRPLRAPQSSKTSTSPPDAQQHDGGGISTRAARHGRCTPATAMTTGQRRACEV